MTAMKEAEQRKIIEAESVRDWDDEEVTADFIAAARTEWPKALRKLEAVRGLLKRIRERQDKYTRKMMTVESVILGWVLAEFDAILEEGESDGD